MKLPYIIFLLIPLFTSASGTWEREPQKSGERIFTNPPEHQHKINLTELEIFGPLIMRVAHDRGIALYDYATFNGYFFPPDNYSSPVSIGDGKGGGPREFVNPTDTAFDNEGNIWIADPQQGRISVWRRDGDLLRTINPAPRQPHRIALTANRCIIFGSGGDHTLFKIADVDGNKIDTIENIGSDMLGWIFTYEGYLTSDRRGFVYTGLWYGIIRKYTEDGELVYSRGTIDPVGPAKPEHRTIEGTRVVMAPRDAPMATLSSYIANEKLYLLSPDNNDNNIRMIDVYELSTGDYRYSIPLPERTRFIGITGNTLISLEGRDEEPFFVISVYRLNND